MKILETTIKGETIIPLMHTRTVHAGFNIEHRSLLTPEKNIKLSPTLSRFFLKLTLQPSTLLSYRDLSEQLNNFTLSHFLTHEKKQNLYAANNIRVMVCRLRQILTRIDPQLRNTIETVNKSGIIYTPDVSVRAFYRHTTNDR